MIYQMSLFWGMVVVGQSKAVLVEDMADVLTFHPGQPNFGGQGNSRIAAGVANQLRRRGAFNLVIYQALESHSPPLCKICDVSSPLSPSAQVSAKRVSSRPITPAWSRLKCIILKSLGPTRPRVMVLLSAIMYYALQHIADAMCSS